MPLDPIPDDTPQAPLLPPPLTLAELLHARTPRLLATPAIAVSQIAVFAVMALTTGALAFPAPTLIAWGGQFAPAIADDGRRFFATKDLPQEEKARLRSSIEQALSAGG